MVSPLIEEFPISSHVDDTGSLCNKIPRLSGNLGRTYDEAYDGEVGETIMRRSRNLRLSAQ